MISFSCEVITVLQQEVAKIRNDTSSGDLNKKPHDLGEAL
jgi:hypothetical protein